MPSLRKSLIALLLAVFSSLASASSLEEWISVANKHVSKLDHQSKPYTVTSVRAATPSKMIFGYVESNQACYFFVNQSADLENSTEVEITVSVLHEIGHCLALRNRLQNIETGLTRQGESFADVYALAWVYYNDRGNFEKAFSVLCAIRSDARRINRAYDTLMSMKTAKHRLENTDNVSEPYQFTAKLFSPD